MAVELVMPRLSESMEEGTIVAWLVPDGAQVREGEEIAEIETDKATLPYEAPEAGVLRILVPEGTTLALGSPIGLIDDLAPLPGGQSVAPPGAATTAGGRVPAPRAPQADPPTASFELQPDLHEPPHTVHASVPPPATGASQSWSPAWGPQPAAARGARADAEPAPSEAEDETTEFAALDPATLQAARPAATPAPEPVAEAPEASAAQEPAAPPVAPQPAAPEPPAAAPIPAPALAPASDPTPEDAASADAASAAASEPAIAAMPWVDISISSRPAPGAPAPSERRYAPDELIAPQTLPPRPPELQPTASAARIKASPVARRLARELGIDLSTIEGSGPEGRVVRADIEAAQATGAARPPKPRSATPSAASEFTPPVDDARAAAPIPPADPADPVDPAAAEALVAAAAEAAAALVTDPDAAPIEPPLSTVADDEAAADADIAHPEESEPESDDAPSAGEAPADPAAGDEQPGSGPAIDDEQPEASAEPAGDADAVATPPEPEPTAEAEPDAAASDATESESGAVVGSEADAASEPEPAATAAGAAVPADDASGDTPVADADPADAAPVDAPVDAPEPTLAPDDAPAPVPVAESRVLPAAQPGGGKGEPTVVELTRQQQTVARRMAESKATIPDFHTSVEIDAAPLLALRAELTATRPDLAAPSVNDLLVKATAIALRAFPALNGAYRDGRLEQYPKVNVGIAVDAGGKLLVPVVHDADRLSVSQIAARTDEVVGKARDGSLRPPDIASATFTLSNLGALGVDRFTAVITPGQAGILTAGSIAERPVVRGGEVVAGTTMILTLTTDHRAVYGAQAAAFLGRVRELLERPSSLLA